MALQSSIGDVLITKFSDTVFRLAQQTMARTRVCVEMEQLNAEQMMFPRIGSAEVQQLNTRFAEIIPADIQWDNRRLSGARFGLPLFVDKWDAERMLSDPQSELAVRATQALERNLDRIVIASATSVVYTGRTGTVPVTAANDGVTTVDALSGFTYEILLQIDANFQAQEVGMEAPLRKFLLISEQEHQALMKEGTLISGDFTRQYVVEQGYMIKALDFDIIRFGSGVPQPMLPVTSNQRACLAIAYGGIKLGITQAWEIDIEKRTDRWQTTQVLAVGTCGAVRMEGVRIQQVNTTPAPNPA